MTWVKRGANHGRHINRAIATKPIKLMFMCVAVGLAVTQITLFVDTIAGQIDKLTINRTHEIQWSLGQMEAEYLRLINAIPDTSAEVTDTRSIQRTREFFVKFSGRVDEVATSDVFREFRTQDTVANPLTIVIDFASGFQRVMGSEPATISNVLPELRMRAELIGPEVHSLSLSGLQLAQQYTESQTRALMQLFLSLLVQTILLIAFLIALIWVLRRMNLSSRNSVAELQVSQEKTETMVSAALDGILMMDSQGKLIDANPPARDIFGLHFSKLETLFFSDLLADNETSKRIILPLDTSTLRSGRIVLTGLRYDGSEFPMELSLARTPTEHNGQVFVAYVRDISDRIESEKALKKARDDARAGEKAKADLLAVMSHEFRTPLYGILGAIELVNKTNLSDKQIELVAAMKTSSDLLLRHVNDVLDLSKLDSGASDLKEEPFELAAMVTELANSQRAHAEKQSNSIKVNLFDGLPEIVVGDLQKIQQALLNLIGNALKFTECGVITLEVEAIGADSLIEFRVFDTGIGIDNTLLHRIFDDFFAIDTSFGRLRDGTGLGLGITRRLIKALQGEIGAESIPGEGSLLWIRLPLSEIQHRAPLQEDAQKITEIDGTLKLLLVEDNPVNRMITGTMLRNAGHSVEIAEDGETSVERSKTNRYDLILMDISMPGMDGIEATRNIRETSALNSDTPIVALTAQSQPEAHQAIKAAGIDQILTKPATEADLHRLLSKFYNKRPYAASNLNAKILGAGVLNKAVLEEVLRNIGREKTTEHRDLFVADLQRLIDTLESVTLDAIVRKEVVLCREVHALSGAAAVLGLRSLATHFIAFERACETPETCDWDDWIVRTKLLWNESRDALNAHLAA